MVFLLFFCFCSWIVFSGFIGCLVLFNYPKGNKLSNRLLAFGIFSISLNIALIGLCYFKNFYISYPQTYRLLTLIQYFTAPLFYLFIRTTLLHQKYFDKWDLLYFIPFVVHFIEFIPFYTMPTQEKINYLQYGYSNIRILTQSKNATLLPKHHHLLKTTTGLVFGILQTKLVLNNKNNINKASWNWLIKLCLIYNLSYLCNAKLIMPFQMDTNLYSIFVLGSIQCYCIFSLLKKPVLLVYTIDKPLKKNEHTSLSPNEIIDEPRKFILSPARKKMYKEKLETFVAVQKPYLIKKYSISQLANDTNIPTHHLSLLINEEYGCNYNDYINRYRINYFIENRYKNEWRTFSLEGLAYQSGFNSRNAFTTSFKKFTNESPTTFFKNKDASELVLKCEKARKRKFKNELTV
ncbi:helix-turn-helix domain protein [Flavobacterium succinicans]|uniref:Helix-turn-helix domain protein n=2 Tax=Flavobacterium succinicans TaxID=29536 RepID=A0A199XTK7_9FLAO|nr:helix-turn-helix domain protein [Flavobacterium succinicans]